MHSMALHFVGSQPWLGTAEGTAPWDQITELVQRARRGRRYAAIAFLGPAAPGLLPLQNGDILVVNASDSAVKSHSTSPAAIEDYLRAGVSVYNEPLLHAKVIALPGNAVIGSANASTRSRTQAIEAVVITEEQTVVRQVRRFITKLADPVMAIEHGDVPRLWKLWHEGGSEGTGVPGVNRGPDGELGDGAAGFVIAEWGDGEFDEETAAQISRKVARIRRETGIGYDWIELGEGGPYPDGTWVYWADLDGIDPPREFVGGARRAPGGDGEEYQVFRYLIKDEDDWRTWDEVHDLAPDLRKKVVRHRWYLEGRFEDKEGIGDALRTLWPSRSAPEIDGVASAEYRIEAIESAGRRHVPRKPRRL